MTIVARLRADPLTNQIHILANRARIRCPGRKPHRPQTTVMG